MIRWRKPSPFCGMHGACHRRRGAGEPRVNNAGRRAARHSIAVIAIVAVRRPQVAAELLGAAGVLADAIGASVHALVTFGGEDVARSGSTARTWWSQFVGARSREDGAAALVGLVG